MPQPPVSSPPVCPACDHPVILNVTRCEFCLRPFHELCLSSRGCNTPACYAARHDPPLRFYEWRQLGAVTVAAVVLVLLVTGTLSRPAADAGALPATALAAAAITGLIGYLMHQRRRSGRKPWKSRISYLAALASSFLCVLVSAAIIRPIPGSAYDLIAVATAGTGAFSLCAILSPFSRAAGIFGVLLSLQTYAMILLSATPRVDRLSWSLSETYRQVRDGALPPASYHPRGVIESRGKTLVMTDGGAYGLGERIPGIGKVLGVSGSRVRVLNSAGREISLAIAPAGGQSQAVSPAASAPSERPPSAGEIPDEKIRGLLKDLKDYDRVRQTIEADVLKKRR